MNQKRKGSDRSDIIYNSSLMPFENQKDYAQGKPQMHEKSTREIYLDLTNQNQEH